MKVPSTAILLTIAANGAYGFVTHSAPTFQKTSRMLLRSSSEPDATLPTQSGGTKKNIGYDEATGRFYEMTGECDPVNEYCVVDEDTGKYITLTVEEKERIFLDALQSYYASGRQLLTDDEFDLLKEDLSWSGSEMVNMNRKEAKYLSAMSAYLKGSPIMSDAEFDTIKADLKEEGSKFAVDTEPQCYIDTGVCKVTLQEDFFRTNLLYLPAGAILSVLWLGIGYEVASLVFKINPVILLALGYPVIAKLTKDITDNFIFENNKVVYGPCPSCEAENRIYFGNILGVEGFGDTAEVKCPNCKEVFLVKRDTLRATTLPKTA